MTLPLDSKIKTPILLQGQEKAPEKGRNDDSIYGEIGDYVAGDRRREERERRDDRPRGGYFDKPIETEKQEGKRLFV